MADIELVIKIPEELYGQLIELENPTYLAQCVIKGKQLPKGHGRLIEVTNQLEQELFTFQRYTGIDEAPYESATIITDRAPTIIEADTESEDKE